MRLLLLVLLLLGLPSFTIATLIPTLSWPKDNNVIDFDVADGKIAVLRSIANGLDKFSPDERSEVVSIYSMKGDTMTVDYGWGLEQAVQNTNGRRFIRHGRFDSQRAIAMSKISHKVYVLDYQGGFCPGDNPQVRNVECVRISSYSLDGKFDSEIFLKGISNGLRIDDNDQLVLYRQSTVFIFNLEGILIRSFGSCTRENIRIEKNGQRSQFDQCQEGDEGLCSIRSIALDGEKVYIVDDASCSIDRDVSDSRIVVFDIKSGKFERKHAFPRGQRDGEVSTSIGGAAVISITPQVPGGIRNSKIVITDFTGDRIQSFDLPSFEFHSKIGVAGWRSGQFSTPSKIATWYGSHLLTDQEVAVKEEEEVSVGVIVLDEYPRFQLFTDGNN